MFIKLTQKKNNSQDNKFEITEILIDIDLIKIVEDIGYETEQTYIKGIGKTKICFGTGYHADYILVMESVKEIKKIIEENKKEIVK